MIILLVYKLTNKVNGKCYIGQTSKMLKERMRKHYDSDKMLVDKAISLYGKNNFDVEVIDHAFSIEELYEKERYWIKYYNSLIPNGYNQCLGGKTSEGFKHRDSSKKLMSEWKRKNYIGDKNPFWGKHHSTEQIAKWEKERKNNPVYKENAKKATLASLEKTRRKVRNITTNEVFSSIKEAAGKYNLKDTHISRVCRGKRKSTGGFLWEYVD